MGRFGSLIASTCRSNQSLAAWLVAQIMGPARTIPASATGQVVASGAPDDTTPHMKAQMGANQVIGLSSSAMTGHAGTDEGAGRVRDDMPRILGLTLVSVNLNLHLLRPPTIPQTVAVPYPRSLDR